MLQLFLCSRLNSALNPFYCEFASSIIKNSKLQRDVSLSNYFYCGGRRLFLNCLLYYLHTNNKKNKQSGLRTLSLCQKLSDCQLIYIWRTHSCSWSHSSSRSRSMDSAFNSASQPVWNIVCYQLFQYFSETIYTWDFRSDGLYVLKVTST